MSADREVAATNIEPAVAAAATGAPVVSGVATPRASAPVLCANCGVPLSGHYCSNCGQRVEHAVHSLSHFLGEVAEDLTHADSRLWRTIGALLFKPGYLTQEFLAGRRVKYLPPLRLYLVLSLFFFLIATANNRHVTLKIISGGDDDISIPAVAQPLQPGEDRRQHAEKVCAKLRYDGPWQSLLLPALRTGCQNAVEDDGRSLREDFFHNLPRAIFVMVPILAAAMKPLYRRQRRYYVEHLLFLLHNHSFVFLWLGLFVLITLVIPIEAVASTLAFVFGIYIPFYYYRSMRQVYGEGTGRTLGKFAVLSLAYLVTAGLVLVATGLYSVLVQ
ncbi:MAG TPA: DUF3667 domain-containing protein [Steroidobacteraceae bacterium]|jgi:hypothetical protein|nr:DUF3667 domain-containing protein [Steroidobacteraceae bacterium]